MIRRLVRTLMLFTLGPLAALVFKRVLDERRSERRLATPTTDWPDVPVDPASGPAAPPDAPPHEEAVHHEAVRDGLVYDITTGGLARQDDSTPPRGPGTPGTPEAKAWVEPDAGSCPIGHPVKVKQRSSLYHLPGMVAYGRTLPDRCYAVAEDAERDGFTRARR